MKVITEFAVPFKPYRTDTNKTSALSSPKSRRRQRGRMT